MRDHLTLGPVPAGEDCAQVGQANYLAQAQAEVQTYINQLKRLFPIPQEIDVSFGISRERHDFGTYYEAKVMFDDTSEAASDFAFNVENNIPEKWDEQARAELRQRGFPAKESVPA